MFGKKKTEEVEFTGVSVSNEKRNAIVLFIIEAVVVLIFIAGVLFVLNYFNIFPLSKINPTLFNFLPVREEGQNLDNKTDDINSKQIPLPTRPVDKTIQGSMEVASDIPNYQIILNNEQELIRLLRDWDIYGNYFYDTNTAYNSAKPLSTIRVRLNPSPQRGILLSDTQGNPYLSYNITTTEGIMDLYVNISEETLRSEKADLGDLVTYAVIAPLYRFANSVPVKELEEREKALGVVITEQIENNYFQVIQR